MVVSDICEGNQWQVVGDQVYKSHLADPPVLNAAGLADRTGAVPNTSFLNVTLGERASVRDGGQVHRRRFMRSCSGPETDPRLVSGLPAAPDMLVPHHALPRELAAQERSQGHGCDTGPLLGKRTCSSLKRPVADLGARVKLLLNDPPFSFHFPSAVFEHIIRFLLNLHKTGEAIMM